MIKICNHCGKQFETDNPAKKCCSKECATAETKAHMRPKICAVCGQEFIPTSGVATICSREHHATCEICGKDFVLTRNMIHDKITTCSRACSKEKTRRMYQEKYGVDHPMQSKRVQANHKKAMLDKYGVESPLQSEEIRAKAIDSNRNKFGVDWALGSKEIHKQIKQTMLDRYGGETTLQSEELKAKVSATNINKYGSTNPATSKVVQDKIRETTFEKYGVLFATQDPEVHAKLVSTRLANHDGIYWTPEMQEKLRQTCLEKFGVENPSKSPEVIDKIKSTMLERYGVEWATMLDSARAHVDRLSKINRAFADKIVSELGLDVEFEFPLGGKIFDLKIGGTNVLIEIDPTYTHNAVGNHWTDVGLPSSYHRNKSRIAKEAGYRCIHVFDWDDWDKICMLLQPKTKIYARKCKIYRLNREVTDEFLNKYHIQGSVKGQVLRLGLVCDGQLVQVMTFGKSRYDKSADVELLRLCSRPDVAVVGGAERLFKFATEKMYARNIVSYCDLSKFNGDVYERLGMTKVRQTDPQEIWSKQSQKITANLLRQRGYDQLFNTNFGKGTSNDVLMLVSGWLPVYDCGQAVYKYN